MKEYYQKQIDFFTEELLWTQSKIDTHRAALDFFNDLTRTILRDLQEAREALRNVEKNANTLCGAYAQGSECPFPADQTKVGIFKP